MVDHLAFRKALSDLRQGEGATPERAANYPVLLEAFEVETGEEVVAEIRKRLGTYRRQEFRLALENAYGFDVTPADKLNIRRRRIIGELDEPAVLSMSERTLISREGEALRWLVTDVIGDESIDELLASIESSAVELVSNLQSNVDDSNMSDAEFREYAASKIEGLSDLTTLYGHLIGHVLKSSMRLSNLTNFFVESEKKLMSIVTTQGNIIGMIDAELGYIYRNGIPIDAELVEPIEIRNDIVKRTLGMAEDYLQFRKEATEELNDVYARIENMNIPGLDFFTRPDEE